MGQENENRDKALSSEQTTGKGWDESSKRRDLSLRLAELTMADYIRQHTERSVKRVIGEAFERFRQTLPPHERPDEIQVIYPEDLAQNRITRAVESGVDDVAKGFAETMSVEALESALRFFESEHGKEFAASLDAAKMGLIRAIKDSEDKFLGQIGEFLMKQLAAQHGAAKKGTDSANSSDTLADNADAKMALVNPLGIIVKPGKA